MNIVGRIWDKITSILLKRPMVVEEINSTVANIWENPNDREQITGIIQSFEKDEQKRILASIIQLNADIQKIDVKKAKLEDKLSTLKTITATDISAINESVEKLNQFVKEKPKQKLIISIYKPKSTDSLDALLKQNNLLKQFQDREIARKKKAEQHKKEVRTTLDKIAILLNQDKLDESKTLIAQIQNQIKSSYTHEIERLEKSKQKLKDRELQIFVKRQQEEQKRREEEAKRLREEVERREKAEKEKREREEIELNAKLEKRQQEREKLETLLVKKPNWQDFQQILQQNEITTLYHFTDIANIRSIKEHGGLFSWYYCDMNGIDIPLPGGGSLSRDLDKRYYLQDYVRVSFTRNHPMMYVAKNDNRIKNPVILEIKLDVAYLENTCFADMNATKNGHTQGANLDNLKVIHFRTVKQPNHFDLDESEKPYYQAEVLVKTWIPIKYITNINNF